MIEPIELLPHPETGILVPEEWRDIADYEGIYQVSNYGRIKTFNKRKGITGRVIKGSLHGRGYPQIQLFKDGVMTCYKKHILVAHAFIPNPQNKRTVNHKFGNKADNFYLRLEWATDAENISH